MEYYEYTIIHLLIIHKYDYINIYMYPSPDIKQFF